MALTDRDDVHILDMGSAEIVDFESDDSLEEIYLHIDEEPQVLPQACLKSSTYSNKPGIEYRLYKRRYWVLFLFTFMLFFEVRY
mgnify:CR=1 FL=1